MERLLVEAGTVATRWESATFREHGAREAAKLFLPSFEDAGAGRALAARALRECLRALHAIGNDGARQHIAIAMRNLIEAIRTEPNEQPESEPTRPYWIEPDS